MALQYCRLYSGYWPRSSATLLLALLVACSGQPQQQEDQRKHEDNAAATASPESGLPAEEATVVSYSSEEFDDPLMGFNRAIFVFNDISYRYVMIPVVNTYTEYAPQPLRTGIANVFANIKSPISIVNHLLQGEAGNAGRDTLRFLVNSTVGIAGIFDPADAWLDVPAQTTSFNDTLEQYGTGYGTYIVLPFLGPADLRRGAGVVADYFLNPIPYLTEQPDTFYIMAADALQDFSGKAESYATLREKSDDPYLFFRNMYLQGKLRDAQFDARNEEESR